MKTNRFGDISGRYSEPDRVINTIEKKIPTVEVIIPSLNEAATIGDLICGIYSSCSLLPISFSVLVIDGGSTDDTVNICRRKNVKFRVQSGKGKGNAMKEAADCSEADIIVFIDGDGTYSPSDMKRLLEPLLNGESEMVVGSRAIDKREKGSISLLNRLGNKLFNISINLSMGSSVSDSLSGYRALSRRTFESLILFSENFEIEVELTVEAIANGIRISEVPVIYSTRNKLTKTKLQPFWDGIRIARTLLFILMNVNPLRSLSLISLIFFLIGLYPTFLVLYEKIVYGDIIHLASVVFASLLFMMSAISIVLGLISELIVRSRKRCEYLIRKIIRDR